MTTSLDMSARYIASKDAMESRLGDETVILHLVSGTYFGLDAVGTVVWDALQAGATPDAICARVRAEFADAPASVETDVAAFLAQLLAHALILPD
jgi:hypothetical protein